MVNYRYTENLKFKSFFNLAITLPFTTKFPIQETVASFFDEHQALASLNITRDQRETTSASLSSRPMAIKSYCFCDVRVALTPGNITLTTLPVRPAMEAREKRKPVHGALAMCGREGRIRRTRSSDFVPNAAPEPLARGPVNAAGTSDVVHRRMDGPWVRMRRDIPPRIHRGATQPTR